MSHIETALEQICVIVNFGFGSKVIDRAKRLGITGGTILLGKGTINSRILDFFGISNERKEIVIMVADKKTARSVLEELNKAFMFYRPHHGIAFSISVCSVVGARCDKYNNIIEEGENETMYQAITTIVDKGKSEDVIDAARKAGSKGGTIINARGSGLHETQKLFSMDIEPEKEIVLILAEKDMTEAIVESIREHLKIDEPGMGILFIQDINKTYGLYK